MTEGKLQWHPAFVAALHIEFEDEMEGLEIKAEHLLGKKPMQIDVLVIKKEKKQPLHKNIGQIFRRYNIIEYKSPEDYLSENDFYKVYGYACFFKADTKRINEIRSKDLTITYICNHFPRKMLTQLKENRKLVVKKHRAGIYYIIGDEFPIQVVVIKELSKKDNYWLQSLRNDLKGGEELRSLFQNYEEKKKDPYYQAVMDLIVKANQKQIEEDRTMSEVLKKLLYDMYGEEIEQKEAKKIKQGIEQAEQRTKKIFKLSYSGVSAENIAKECGISVEKVCQILE